ncbi:putative ring-cleaving dioxygenase MhqO [compost metagenome]
MTTTTTEGIHHITAFVNDVQETVDFYAGVLGLRLVKKTINFDAPEIYHLYFGNELGEPGTIVTFFPQENARQGILGGGQVGVTVYAIPAGSLFYWRERLKKYEIKCMDTTRFGEDFVRFTDPSGLLIDLVEREEGKINTWSFSGIPQKYAIKGFGGALLFSRDSSKTALVLENVLGLERIDTEDGLIRYKSRGNLGNIIDLNAENMESGLGGAGTVHHIAWRVKDYDEQLLLHNLLDAIGFQPTPVVNRQYFKAVYFREGGGILFEIATDPPGFATDEPEESLGEQLMLPDWYESERIAIESMLKPFEVRSLE